MKIIFFPYLVLVALLFSCSTHSNKQASIEDYKLFPSRKIIKSGETFEFEKADIGKYPKKIMFLDEEYDFEDFLEYNETVAFIIIKNDTIQFEKYFDGFKKESIIPSFSMAKSFISLLIGCAIDDGYINSTEELVIDYLPELVTNGFSNVKLKHLLQMTSGLEFNEDYLDTNSQVGLFYQTNDLRKETLKLKLKKQPGLEFEYLSGNTQLLGLILERALKNKTISEYFQERIWKRIGTEYDASWSLDNEKNGIEKTFCCFNSTAIDYAKIGRLYLNNGTWDQRKIVSESWIDETFKIDSTDGSVWYYQNHWWLPTQLGDYIAEGVLGQYIYLNTNNNVIIVRLGKSEGLADWDAILSNLGRAYNK